MKSNHSFLSVLSFLIITIFLSCGSRENRPVVPYDIDTDEIFKALAPNEEEDSNGVTFGDNNIAGFIFDYDMTTENPDIFVYYQNLTVLDINPDINQSLLEFIFNQLKDGGFVNDSIASVTNEYVNFIENGISYSEAAANILDSYKQEFEKQYSEIESFNSPFNIYFQIYPVYLDNKFVTYRQYAYSYTGGAHGITVSYLKTYNLESGKELTLEEVVKPDAMTEVHNEVAAHMAYSYPIYENITTVNQYLDSLNVWLGNSHSDVAAGQDNLITASNYPLTNPGILKEGIAFVYQMYTMAPGADGCPVVMIPYSDLKGCLYPDFKK